MIWRDSLSDPDLGRCTDSARLLWDALIQLADDDGRGLADLDFLRAEVWRYHSNRRRRWVEKILQELVQKMRNLRLYEVNGRCYYAFGKWKEYQAIRKDLYKPSKFPPPPLRACDETVTNSEGNRNGTSPQISVGQNRLGESQMQRREGEVEEREPTNEGETGSAPASSEASASPASKNSITDQELALAKRFYGSNHEEFMFQLKRCGCNAEEAQRHWEECLKNGHGTSE